MSTLYEITEGIQRLETILEDPSIEGDEALAEALGEAMENFQEDLEQKVDGIVHMLRNWDATAAMFKAEERRLADRRKVFENKGARLRAYLLTEMQRAELPEIKLPFATVGRKAGSERIEIDDDLNLPQGYYEIESNVKPDKNALKKLWKDTPEDARAALPGFHVERGPESLSIK